MSLIIGTIVGGLLAEIGKGLVTDSVKDKIKNYFNDERDNFEKELTSVITDSIEEYKVKFPIIEGDKLGKFSFIESQGLIDNLLKFSFFKDDKIDLNSGLDEFGHVIQANEEEIKNLLELFQNNIDQNENLRDLEITNRSAFIVSKVYDEVKKISTNVESLAREITNKASAELSSEYSAILRDYEKDILEFRPKSALRHLLSLKQRMEEKGLDDTSLLSKVYHFIGRAYSDSFNKEECAKHYIQAYELSQNSPHHKMFGAIGYLSVNNLEKAIELLSELINSNSFNHRAQALKASLVPGYFNEVPEYSKSHKDFKYYYAHQLFSDDKTVEAYEVMKSEFDEFESCEITPDNYKRVIFISQLNFFHFYRQTVKTTLFFWQEPSIAIQSLNFAINRLEAIYEKIKDTEVAEDYNEVFFFLKFAIYSKTGDPVLVDGMLTVFNKLSSIVKQHRCENMAISLSQQKRFPEALVVLEESDFGNTYRNLYMAAQLSAIQSDHEKTSKYLKRFVLEASNFDDLVISCSGEYITTYCPENERAIFLSELTDRCTENDILYLNGLIDLIDNKNWESDKCQELYKSLTLNDDAKKRVIATTLWQIKDLNNAIHVIDKDKEITSDSINCDILIDTLNQLKIQSERLLKILKEKRDIKNYPHWLEIELNLLSSIPNWDTVIELSKEGLKEFPDSLRFVEFLIFGLYNEDRTDEISQIFEDYKNSPSWTQKSAIQLAQVLCRSDLNELALDLIYPFAKEKDNTVAREFYAFGIGLKIKGKEFKGKESIDVNTIIEIKVNNNIRILEVTESTIQHNPLISEISNWNIGDKNFIENGDEVELISILPLKYGLIKEIYHDLSEREGVGYRSKSVAIKGDDPKDLLEQLHSMVGDGQIERKEHQQKTLKRYNDGEESLSVTARILFAGNYINTFNFLTGPNSKYIVKPNTFFTPLTFDPNNEYILDWSSVILFFHLQNNNIISFDKDFFTISNRLLEELEEIIFQESQLPSSLSIHFNESGAIPILYPENAVDLRIEFYNALKIWVKRTCKVERVPEKLDTLLKLREENKMEPNLVYFLDTVYLANRKSHILISDDTIWEKFGLYAVGKVISTQFYLSKSNPQLWSLNVAGELLKLSFSGITMTSDILKNVYLDLGDSQAQKFVNALKNIPFKIGQNPNIIGEALEFIKYIYSLEIQLKIKKRVTMQVFNYLVEELDMVVLKTNIEKLIRIKFMFHQQNLVSVLEDFDSSI